MPTISGMSASSLQQLIKSIADAPPEAFAGIEKALLERAAANLA